MRDILVTALVVGSFPVCFRRPFVGLLVFSVLAYMRLQDLAWGFARDQRWSFYVAILTFAGWLASRDRKLPVLELRTVMMGLLVLVVGMGHFFFARGDSGAAPARYSEYVKIIGISVFTTALVRTRQQLRILVWVICMCFAFYGVKAGVVGIIKLGNIYIKRGPGGMIEDNNDFALALTMSIPMLLHLGTSERRDILRKGVWLMIPLTMVTVVLTRSRGGTLSLVWCIVLLVWRSQNRLIGLLLMILAAGAAITLAPAEYKERIATIKDYRSEGSAAGRLAAWTVAGRMIMDNPVWGVGFRRFQQNYVDYEPNPTAEQLSGQVTIVAHNSYLQIWAECGTIAFGLYMGLIFLSFWDLWSLRRQARRRYHASWILSYCTMFEVVMATFLLGSVFLNRAHFDLIYHYVAIVLVFGRVARRDMADEERYPVRIGTQRAGGLVAVDQAGFDGQRRVARTFRHTELVPQG